MTKPTRNPQVVADIERILGAKIDTEEGQIKLLGSLVFRALNDSRFEEGVRIDLFNTYTRFISAHAALDTIVMIAEEVKSKHLPIEAVLLVMGETLDSEVGKAWGFVRNILSLVHDKPPSSSPPKVIHL